MAMEDKKTIGVTDRGAPVLDTLVEGGRFADAIDAAKFAMALAIRAGAAEGVPNPSVEGAGTKWNVGSFDPNNDLQTLLVAFYPGVETPYRLLEYLIDEGLKLIARHIAEWGMIEVSELIRDGVST
jgi:hypothetical protein